MKRFDARTLIIDFERQLRPQPPEDAKPHFCYIDTLVFYDKKLKEVWRQHIPEADWLGFQREYEGNNDLEHRHKQSCVRVEFSKEWGWLLKFSITHEQAKNIWKVLFPQVNLDKPLYQKKEVLRRVRNL